MMFWIFFIVWLFSFIYWLIGLIIAIKELNTKHMMMGVILVNISNLAMQVAALVEKH